MAGAHCERFPDCMALSDEPKAPKCAKDDCPGKATWRDFLLHSMPKHDACEHDFQGWRQIDGGLGGERVCTKCGMGAMAHTLSLGI